MTGVISALPANHRLGGSLENLILKISSRVNARRCLWGKLVSSMIRYHLNVTFDFSQESKIRNFIILVTDHANDGIFACIYSN